MDNEDIESKKRVLTEIRDFAKHRKGNSLRKRHGLAAKLDPRFDPEPKPAPKAQPDPTEYAAAAVKGEKLDADPMAGIDMSGIEKAAKVPADHDSGEIDLSGEAPVHNLPELSEEEVERLAAIYDAEHPRE